jgi:hypothetical protein
MSVARPFISTMPMSQLIASDAPLLSPISCGEVSPWDHSQSPSSEQFDFGYSYSTPPSPPHSTGSEAAHSPTIAPRMLKVQRDEQSQSQLCLPTNQVFDLPTADGLYQMPTPSSPLSPASSPAPPRLSISIKPKPAQPPVKRSASPAPSVTKKARAAISSKDFIPPDVSGLSKREARLVKNRAAAFLSRQRKREEYELMEM